HRSHDAGVEPGGSCVVDLYLLPGSAPLRPRRRTALLIGRRPLDLEQERLLVLHLERRVLEAEALLQQPLEAPARLVTVRVWGDANVRRERREPGGDFPHVEAVDLDDPGGARAPLP